MNTRIKVILALIAVVLTAALPLRAQQSLNDVDWEQVKKLQMAQVAITCLYVDSVDQQKVAEDAIRGILAKLDPHSTYTNAKETRKLNEPIAGNFEGIGVSFNMVEDTLVVMSVVKKGPCEKAGILAGDRIVSCNDTVIAGVKMDRDSIMQVLRGPKGSKARLRVVRRAVTDTLVFHVTRDKIPLHTLDAAYMIDETTGYLRLTSFGAQSGKEVHNALATLRKKGMKDVILDLSSNGGGLMSAAQDVASEFLPEGSMVVYAKGRSTADQQLRAGNGGLMQKEGRVVVVVDEYTASAAEIVSGAIQDHDRGTIIGRRTFGKGLVQRPVDLPDGSMIRLTVAHYYTPSGRCVQKPYTKGDKAKYDKDLEARFNHGELTCIDSIHLDSTAVYKTLGKGRTVYGGGGIMPDVFVPLDTTWITPPYRQLRRYNLINDEVLHYVDTQRKSIKRKYSDFDKFMAQYKVPNAVIDSLYAKGERKGMTFKDKTEKEKTTSQLRLALKELVAYHVYDTNDYYRLLNQRNDLVLRAIRYLKEEEQ